MAKRRMGIIVFLFCLCLGLAPLRVSAASTADAKEPISTFRTCTLTLTYGHDGTAFADVPVKLYKIADVSSKFRYTLTSPFTTTGLTINGIRSNAEWNTVRTTLEAHILAENVAATHESTTNAVGQVCFEALQPGLYLAVADRVVREEFTCSFDSALIALPDLDANGYWQYQVAAVAKPVVTILPKPDDPTPETEIQLQIVKLWKGDEGKTDRPESVTAEIFRDGICERTVTLSAENNWAYTWTAKDDGAEWMVAECDVPAGYTAMLEVRGTAFVLTNTRIPDDPQPDDPTPDDPDKPQPDDPTPDTPPDNPQTGDSANVMLYVVLMFISGIMMILLGVTGKRKRT